MTNIPKSLQVDSTYFHVVVNAKANKTAQTTATYRNVLSLGASYFSTGNGTVGGTFLSTGLIVGFGVKVLTALAGVCTLLGSTL
jgi:hypothetical protein